jgi:hypothetical protein
MRDDAADQVPTNMDHIVQPGEVWGRFRYDFIAREIVRTSNRSDSNRFWLDFSEARHLLAPVTAASIAAASARSVLSI